MTLKIVFVTNSFFPQIGGVEWSVLFTAHHLQELGHQVQIITECKSSATDDYEENEIFQSIEVLRFRIRAIRPFTRLRIWRWMFEHKTIFQHADVIHFHDYGSFLHWYFPLRFLLKKKLYAMTYHGFDSYPLKRKDLWMRKLTDAYMDLHFTVGDYQNKYYHSEADYSFLGAPTRTYHARSEPTRSHILFLGRLESDTGFDIYLRVLDDAAAQFEDRLEVTVLGSGSLEHLLRRHDQTVFSLVHRTPTIHIEEYIARAEIVCASSYLSIFDSMAMQRCVLIYASNALKREYIFSIPNIAACAFVAGDEDELRKYLLVALKDCPERDEKVKNASRLVESLSWHDIAQNHLYHYERILNSSIG